MHPVLIATLSLLGLGLLLGGMLVIAARIFFVREDPRIEAVTGALLGANCGACGFAGCAAAATAVVAGKAGPSVCVAGGNAIAIQVARVLGIEVRMREPEMAVPRPAPLAAWDLAPARRPAHSTPLPCMEPCPWSMRNYAQAAAYAKKYVPKASLSALRMKSGLPANTRPPNARLPVSVLVRPGLTFPGISRPLPRKGTKIPYVSCAKKTLCFLSAAVSARRLVNLNAAGTLRTRQCLSIHSRNSLLTMKWPRAGGLFRIPLKRPG